GDAERQRLQQRERQPLPRRAVDQTAGQSEGGGDVVDGANKADPAASRGGARFQLGSLLTLADDDDVDPVEAGVAGRLDQRRPRLLGDQPADADDGRSYDAEPGRRRLD